MEVNALKTPRKCLQITSCYFHSKKAFECIKPIQVDCNDTLNTYRVFITKNAINRC